MDRERPLEDPDSNQRDIGTIEVRGKYRFSLIVTIQDRARNVLGDLIQLVERREKQRADWKNPYNSLITALAAFGGTFVIGPREAPVEKVLLFLFLVIFFGAALFCFAWLVWSLWRRWNLPPIPPVDEFIERLKIDQAG